MSQVPISLVGQDTRFSPWRPGFESRTRKRTFLHTSYILLAFSLILNCEIAKMHSTSTGFEPATAGFEVQRAIHCATRSNKCVRRPGIEPGPHAWKARILTIELSALTACCNVCGEKKKYIFFFHCIIVYQILICLKLIRIQ